MCGGIGIATLNKKELINAILVLNKLISLINDPEGWYESERTYAEYSKKELMKAAKLKRSFLSNKITWSYLAHSQIKESQNNDYNRITND